MRDISTFFLQIAFTILYASNSSSVVTILDSVFTSSVVSSDVFPLFFVWLSSILESLTVKAPFKRSLIISLICEEIARLTKGVNWSIIF